jgi:uncharacterized protein
MSDALRRRIYDLYDAYREGRLDDVLDAFDEEIDYVSYAPVEVFPFLGRRRGKAAVAETAQRLRETFEYLSYQPIFLVASGDEAAAIVLARLRQRATGRIIQLFVANFARFRGTRIVEFREFLDSFDAVQQVLGREIDLSKTM